MEWGMQKTERREKNKRRKVLIDCGEFEFAYPL